MHGISHDSVLALTLAAIFGAIGIVHLMGPRFLREAYESWEYSQRLRLITGVLEILAAVWLLDPGSRGWGLGLAAMINFGAVLTLLNHRQYVHAVPGLVIMAAFLPATLALPLAPFPIRFATLEQTAPRDAAKEPHASVSPDIMVQKNTVNPRIILTTTPSSESGNRMVSNLE